MICLFIDGQVWNSSYAEILNWNNSEREFLDILFSYSSE